MASPRSRRSLSVAHSLYLRLPGAVRRPIWSSVRRANPSLLGRVLGSSSDVTQNELLGKAAGVAEPNVRGGAEADALALLQRSVMRIENRLTPNTQDTPSAPVQTRGSNPLREIATTEDSSIRSMPDGDVLWDLRATQDMVNGERGIARYVFEQTSAFLEGHGAQVRSFVSDAGLPLPGRLWPFLATGRLTSDGPGLDVVARGKDSIWYQTSPFDMSYSTSALLPNEVRRPGNRIVVTCFDLIPLLFPELYLRVPAVRAEYHRHAQLLREADRVLCISRSCADDVHRLLEVPIGRVDVIGAGVSDRFRPAPDRSVAHAKVRELLPQVSTEFVLMPSGIDPRKNIDRAIAAYGRLPAIVRSQHHLVLVCKTTESEKAHLLQMAKKAGIQNSFHVAGHVSDEVLVAMYQAAKVTFFPSTYEGFGLPVVESLACHTLVVCSDSSSLPEIVLDSMFRFDPLDVESMTRKLEEVLTNRLLMDDANYDRWIEPYRWSVVADLTSAAFEQARASNGRAGKSADGKRRARVALCSPWPPSPSGVASYTQQLSLALREFAEVTVFDPADSIGVEKLSSFDAIEGAEGSYDAVIVAIGNSEFHVELLDFLRTHPYRCVVHAHDIRLVGLYSSWFAARRTERRSAELLLIRKFYGDRYAQALDRRFPIDFWSGAALGHWLFREVGLLARDIVVHSEFAAEVVRREAPDRRVHVLPHAVREYAPVDEVRERNLLVSMGMVSDTKGIAVLIKALSLVVQTHPDTRMVFVGPGTLKETSAHSMREAAELRRRGTLHVTGHVSTEEYRRWLARASIAIQLRLESNGESSGAISDAFAAGVPVVVSDNGPNGSLPAAAVVRVPVDVTPEQLAREIVTLLDDETGRLRLVHEAERYARATTFDSVAGALLSVAMSSRTDSVA